MAPSRGAQSTERAVCEVMRAWLSSHAGRIMRKWNALSYGPVLKVMATEELP